MPRRDDIKKILLIGSGPIVIGQACEFDYSGTQGAKALRAGGLRGRPRQLEPGDDHDRSGVRATGPTSSRSTPDVLEAIIERERPDALLPTLGGQTALNLALALHESGVLEKYGVELIGASVEAIRKAEDRALFKEAMAKIGLRCRARRRRAHASRRPTRSSRRSASR